LPTDANTCNLCLAFEGSIDTGGIIA
jgi:hypothetical protein